MQQLVIPAKAGIQSSGNPLKILDSRFHGNDEIMPFSGYYESTKIDELANRHFLTQRRKDAKSLILLFQRVTLASLRLCVMIF
jgi:hypothetical protein